MTTETTETHEKLTPPLVWAGGKRRMLGVLLPLIEARAHVCWVEAFAGGAAVTLAKRPSKVEVLNDLNGHLHNFYRQLRHHPEALELEIASHPPMARESFAEWKTMLHHGTELQRAAAFVMINRTSFGGDNGSFAVRKSSPRDSVAMMADLRAAVSKRLQRVSVECLDWQRLVQNQDSEGTLFFFDPPYLTGVQKAYKGWTAGQFTALAEAIAGLKGQWILTMGDHPEVRAAMPAECLVHEIATNKSITAGDGKPGTFAELVYASPLRSLL